MYDQIFTSYADVVDPETAAKMLNCGRKEIYKLLHNGQLRHYKIGSHYQIPKVWIIDYIISASQVA